MALRKTEPTPPPAVAEEPATPSDKKGAAHAQAQGARGREQAWARAWTSRADSKERRARDRDAPRSRVLGACACGDEKNMPAEHRGPEKRFIRDYIDARTSIGEFLLPLAMLFVVLSLLFKGGAIGAMLILGFYVDRHHGGRWKRSS